MRYMSLQPQDFLISSIGSRRMMSEMQSSGLKPRSVMLPQLACQESEQAEPLHWKASVISALKNQYRRKLHQIQGKTNVSTNENNRSTVAIDGNAGKEMHSKVGNIDMSSEPNPTKEESTYHNAQVEISSLPEVSCVVETVKQSHETQRSTNVCTPKAQMISASKQKVEANFKSRATTAMKIASLIKNPTSLKPKNQTPLLGNGSVEPSNVRRLPWNFSAKNTTSTDLNQENQAIKRQKLDGGKSRQILDIKNRTFLHKSKPGLATRSNVSESFLKADQEKKNDKPRRKVCVREAMVPFVSMAEMVKNFHSKTREIELSHNRSLSHDDATSAMQSKPRLTLTRPKEPELETAQRARPVKIKSSAELEEEMLANMPKFKARPVNKKILEAPSLPAAPPRTTPQLPEFQEFHLKTMERASQHAETQSILSIDSSSCQSNSQSKHNKLTEPRTPHLETMLRARPSKVKSSQELELEELEKMPKFKARPLNKKIFESKGDLGVFCTNSKRATTVPIEFHFAIDERIPLQKEVTDLCDKPSLNSEPVSERPPLPRLTTPNPFHLYTEERGQEKEKKFVKELMQKEWEEEKARIPKAKPYPYTTDYPVIPPKPERKECTKPEVFQLESLVRHEEMQKKIMERERREKEDAQMRIFRAQPIIKDDPIPLPEKIRKPLTQVQGFSLQVDHRATSRAEFHKKIKEKESMYKRMREEYESAQKMEEEKALKQLRRTMVPHAKPVPKFDHPFLPEKSTKETTKPKSPKLHVDKRREIRRLISAASPSHMR